MASIASDEPAWVLLQKKIFTRWCNAYLKLRLKRIEDVYEDFKDGVMLIQLLVRLSVSFLACLPIKRMD